MQLSSTSTMESRVGIDDLYYQARAAYLDDSRFEARFPFCRHVTVALEDRRRLSAISREISLGGLWLLHRTALPPGKVTLLMHDEAAAGDDLPSEIVWCEPCGGGWFMSAVRFLDRLYSS